MTVDFVMVPDVIVVETVSTMEAERPGDVRSGWTIPPAAWVEWMEVVSDAARSNLGSS